MVEDFRPIDRSARLIWGGSAVVLVILLGTAVVLPLFAVGEAVTASSVAAASVLAALWFCVWAHRRWKAWGYAERDVELHIRRGVLIRRLTIIPYGRMQSVDVRQGPLDRALGVSTVVLNTAAAGSDARIPFLRDEEAQRLRGKLTELGEAHAAGL